MGQNRRYGTDLTRAAIAETVLRPTPVSLGKDQVGEEVREATAANLVVAWVPFKTETSVEVEGRAVAFTDRAVCIEFELRDGSKHRAWVWASAVRRR